MSWWAAGAGRCERVAWRELARADTSWGTAHAATGHAFGDVVWAWVPFGSRAPGQGKDRPCVVLGTLADRGDLLLVRMTSRDHDADDDHLFLGYGAWDRSGRGSWADVRHLLRIHHSEVRDAEAALDRMQARALRRRLRLRD